MCESSLLVSGLTGLHRSQPLLHWWLLRAILEVPKEQKENVLVHSSSIKVIQLHVSGVNGRPLPAGDGDADGSLTPAEVGRRDLIVMLVSPHPSPLLLRHRNAERVWRSVKITMICQGCHSYSGSRLVALRPVEEDGSPRFMLRVHCYTWCIVYLPWPRECDRYGRLTVSLEWWQPFFKRNVSLHLKKMNDNNIWYIIQFRFEPTTASSMKM